VNRHLDLTAHTKLAQALCDWKDANPDSVQSSLVVRCHPGLYMQWQRAEDEAENLLNLGLQIPTNEVIERAKLFIEDIELELAHGSEEGFIEITTKKEGQDGERTDDAGD